MKKLLSAFLSVLIFVFIIFSCDNRKGLFEGDRPDAHFGVSQTNIAVGQPVNFSDSSTNMPIEWLWDFGDSTATSTDTNPSHTYYAVGTYKVILTVKNYGGSDTTSRNITVGMIPAANFGAAKTSINVGENVQFNDSSKNAPNKWYWNFGDDSTSTQQNPLHTYSNTGTYTVTLITSNNFGSDTAFKEKYIIVSKAGTAPVADFIVSNTIINIGDIIQFTDKSTNSPINWNWDFGDNETSKDKNPYHKYLTAGTYTVTLIAENSNGKDTEIKSSYITVNPTAKVPDADFNYSPTTITAGQVVTFTDLSTNTPTSWIWGFGDGSATGTNKNPTHSYSAAGTYTVKLTATNSAGFDTISKSITVKAAVVKPVANFSYAPTTITAGQTVTFSDLSTNTPTSWSWSFSDDNSSSTSKNPTHTFTKAGTFPVTLTATNSAGSHSKSSNIIVVGLAPVAAFTASTKTITKGGSVTFTDNSTNTPTSWSWTFGDGGSSDDPNPSHTYNTPGIYTVKLTATNDYGTNIKTETKYIIVNGTITDVEGNVYNTVVIGDQMWMKENLKTTKYRNGDAIGTTTPATLDISGESTPKYQWAYSGNESYVATYGRLYTWYAVTDSRGVCPTGWHVPTDAEWTKLTNYLGGESIAGGKLKETGTTHWTIPNTGATNESGFTALPGGLRDSDGTFHFIGLYDYWWSTTEYDTDIAWYRNVRYDYGDVGRPTFDKELGLSVRCVRD